MKEMPRKMNVVDFAYQIIEMDKEIRSLRSEVIHLTQYKEDYFKLLQESVRHGEEMLGGILQIAMTPGVLEATAKAAQQRREGKPQ